MRYKIFIRILAIVILASVHVAEAQKAGKVYRIGYLSQTSASTAKRNIKPFLESLRELGYVEGKNIVIEYRYAERKLDRLSELAAELVSLKVAAIVTTGTTPGRAAMQATTTIPIVFTMSADPVRSGLVASLARPGGNVTGLSDYHGNLVGKKLELLKELVPSASLVALLFNPNHPANRPMLKDIQAAAPGLGVTLLSLAVKGSDDIDRAFATIRKERAAGVLQFVGLGGHKRQIVDLAAKSQLPAFYTRGRWVAAGGLMSYGSNWPDLFRRAATYVDKILKGAKPADLPVEQPKKFDLIINLKTAKQLGITIPPNILYQATKVIK